MNDYKLDNVKILLLLSLMELALGYSFGCYNCDDFNRVSVKECAHSPEDCGPCKEGCIEDKSDPTICYYLEIDDKPPSRIKSEVESRIQLPCVFNSPVDCVWARNGQFLLIRGESRYQFTSSGTNEDVPSYDCSLTINNVSSHDAGQWQCCSKADSNLDSICSDFVTIEVTQEKHAISSPNHHNEAIAVNEIYQEPIIRYHNFEVQGKELILTNSALSGHRTHQLLRCRTNVIASKITWKLNDKVVEENHQTDEEYLSISKIEDYVGDFVGSIKGKCTATYENGESLTSWVDIAYDFTEINRSVKLSGFLGSTGNAAPVSSAQMPLIIFGAAAVINIYNCFALQRYY